MEEFCTVRGKLILQPKYNSHDVLDYNFLQSIYYRSINIDSFYRVLEMPMTESKFMKIYICAEFSKCSGNNAHVEG
jgi:hypothetical protein